MFKVGDQVDIVFLTHGNEEFLRCTGLITQIFQYTVEIKLTINGVGGKIVINLSSLQPTGTVPQWRVFMRFSEMKVQE